MMNGRGKSDSSVVPGKPPNEIGQPVEEVVEGRELAKGNSPEGNAFRTQRRGDARSALERVRRAARKDRKQKFTALFHHVYDVDRLRTAYLAIKRDASAGIDGETWQHYGENLEGNLADLADRLKRGAYRAKPVKRVYIPKADGRQRPIGMPTLEDKIVQRAVVEVLNAIYEEDFLGFSYGFRRGRNQHQALDALAVGLWRGYVNWVLDADIRGFFDSVDHVWLMKFVEHRIADRRIVRLIQKWLAAGVLEDGTWTPSETGTVQGGSISPLLANLYLHYVFDLWVQRWRTTQAPGRVIVVRFADDFVVGFQRREDAERFLAELRDRFATFGLELHPDKTRLLPFGSRIWKQQHDGRGPKPGTFDFLGFTHVSGRNRRGGYVLLRKTMRKRWQAKLREVRAELRRRMHDSVPEQGKYLRAVVDGHCRYYGVPGNGRKLGAFRLGVMRAWYWTLRRRGQAHPLSKKRFYRYVTRWIPNVRFHHPWPSERFDVTTRSKSRMRESRQSGSVEGVMSDH
jgi:group II intron reverse transcriptase/maturase